MKSTIYQRIIFGGFAAVLLACGGSEKPQQEEPEQIEEVSLEEANENGLGQSLLKIDKEIFSLPSPVQTAILLKKNTIEYNESLLNDPEAAKRYINQFQKSLNMGVYGADLAYLSNFNNTQSKLDYFKVVEQMVNELDIRSHIDQSLIDRFAKNIDVPDSLYVLNAELFNAADRYLKENNEADVAALILTGGWVESMHLTLGSAELNEDLRNRVGEQVGAARSLAKLLSNLDSDLSAELLQRMKGLVDEFDALQYNYTYVKPITDASERVTYLNSRSSVDMTDDQLEAIRSKVEEVRAFIIQ